MKFDLKLNVIYDQENHDVYLLCKEKPLPTTMLKFMVILNISLNTIYKEVISDIQWYILRTSWWLMSAIETNNDFWHVC